jgi:hypothetical protein
MDVHLWRHSCKAFHVAGINPVTIIGEGMENALIYSEDQLLDSLVRLWNEGKIEFREMSDISREVALHFPLPRNAKELLGKLVVRAISAEGKAVDMMGLSMTAVMDPEIQRMSVTLSWTGIQLITVYNIMELFITVNKLVDGGRIPPEVGANIIGQGIRWKLWLNQETPFPGYPSSGDSGAIPPPPRAGSTGAETTSNETAATPDSKGDGPQTGNTATAKEPSPETKAAVADLVAPEQPGTPGSGARPIPGAPRSSATQPPTSLAAPASAMARLASLHSGPASGNTPPAK